MRELDKILMLLILVTIVIFLVTGCARPGYWHIVGRPSGPFTVIEKTNFRQDLYQCRKDAEIVMWGGRGDWLYPGQGRDDWFKGCMRLKGYEWIRGTPPGESYDPLK